MAQRTPFNPLLASPKQTSVRDEDDASSRVMMRFYQDPSAQTGGIAVSILALYCSVDAFWQWFEPQWERGSLGIRGRRRRRATRLYPAEVLTILILFQQSGYRTFKGFYCEHVQVHLRQEFPRALSYSRFVGCCASPRSSANTICLVALAPAGAAAAPESPAAASRQANKRWRY